MHRFYAPAMTASASRVVLDADESAHLARVLRLRVGRVVRVFDGRGTERDGRVAVVHPRASELELLDLVASRATARVHVELAVALLKADKFDAVVRDAVMLGVAAIHPLLTARSEVPVPAAGFSARRQRWHRIAVASVKQSGGATVPELHDPIGLQACLAADRSAARVCLAEPSVAGTERLRVDGRPSVTPESALVLAGPEGGWTPEETDQVRAAGCRLVTLGTRTLRADAVPLVALAVLQFLWGDL